MIDARRIDEFASRISASLAGTPAGDIERNLRALLTSMFGRLDLVTREEFDVQTEVLRRTRAKVAALEARVAALEGARADPAPPGDS